MTGDYQAKLLDSLNALSRGDFEAASDAASLMEAYLPINPTPDEERFSRLASRFYTAVRTAKRSGEDGIISRHLTVRAELLTAGTYLHALMTENDRENLNMEEQFTSHLEKADSFIELTGTAELADEDSAWATMAESYIK